MTDREWIAGFAARLGVNIPSDEEIEGVLRLAAVAAHASERTAAPVACWMAGRAGVTLAGALGQADAVASEAD